MTTDSGLTSPDLDNWQALRRHLVKHADQIARDPALLDALGLQLKSRHLIDFGPAALSRLEARALKDFDVRRQLEMTAKANFDAQNQTHGLALSLMEARNHADLARRLNEESRNRFGLIAASIALEDTAPVPLGWKTLDYGGVDYIIGETGLSLLGPDAVCRVLFDDDTKRIKSAAVLRIALWREGRPGLVAFGSSDFDGFSPDMGAELVAFVSRVVERVAERWPVLP
ncbi:hypothetical protein ABAC460_07700 [Asticcacaulis sp. AC460]|uniref:DUF484 family protein n=1 Tax=Asticcacaulis sp. AC460 TaxID=1282360 RepID=UPI0003C3F324|nr:DUF484 family protein [Asticcacaulis sp. AC460]ESQ90953.1 hypothetical protein ABAC460_07700 [Asticcacaulis sp. AC460]